MDAYLKDHIESGGGGGGHYGEESPIGCAMQAGLVLGGGIVFAECGWNHSPITGTADAERWMTNMALAPVAIYGALGAYYVIRALARGHHAREPRQPAPQPCNQANPATANNAESASTYSYDPPSGLEKLLVTIGAGVVPGAILALGAYGGALAHNAWGDHSAYGMEWQRAQWMLTGMLVPVSAPFAIGWSILSVYIIAGLGLEAWHKLSNCLKSCKESPSLPSATKN